VATLPAVTPASKQLVSSEAHSAPFISTNQLGSKQLTSPPFMASLQSSQMTIHEALKTWRLKELVMEANIGKPGINDNVMKY
jgi:hypothetical protein